MNRQEDKKEAKKGSMKVITIRNFTLFFFGKPSRF
jgi:hypothetical protein